eukprot:Gb_08068 [translate_table: standard]
MKWYMNHPDWWDVSRALMPHPRMLAMARVERRPKGLDGQNSMEKGVMDKPIKGSSQKPILKFLIYGKTRWIGGILDEIYEKKGIPS